MVMECATPVQLYNFLIATTGTVIIDCRPEDVHLKHKLKYPMLIHLPCDKLPDRGSSNKFCQHHVTPQHQTLLSEEEITKAIKGMELLVGPYDRCVLRQRNKASVVLINETPDIPSTVASLASALLQEGKCWAIYHTTFTFEEFGIYFPFMTERKSRRTSNCSISMPTSISLELDDYQIMKQKKTLIPQYPNSILAGHLYLGTRQQALNMDMMRRMQISHIIRAHDVKEEDCMEGSHHDVYRRLDSIKYLDVAVDDKLGTDIGMFIQPCVDFYSEAARTTKSSRIFVHCNMGISRSSTIVIAILMTHRNMNLKEALEYTQKCRHQVQPNYSFMKVLIKYENSLLGDNSIKMCELTKLNAHYSRAYAVDMEDSRPCCVL